MGAKINLCFVRRSSWKTLVLKTNQERSTRLKICFYSVINTLDFRSKIGIVFSWKLMNYVGAGFVFLLFIFIITIGLVVLGYILSVKSNYSREKLSTYECGFEPLARSRQSFCLRFFILAIIFLVFDVEIALLIPYIVSISVNTRWFVRFMVFSFVIILILGLLHEYNEGSLEWIF